MKTLRQIFTNPLMGIQALVLFCAAEFLALMPAAAITAVAAAGLLMTSPSAEAIPPGYYRRGPYSRAGVDRRVARRTSRRTTRRVMRRHGFSTLPYGYRPYVYGGVRYYTYGGLYYYPYFYGGRTVYVQVETNNGVPVPISGDVDIDIDFD